MELSYNTKSLNGLFLKSWFLTLNRKIMRLLAARFVFMTGWLCILVDFY